jgi:hypothetical protein
MVRRGRHAAADGSFGRSAGSTALRGAALLAAAVALGVILLNSSDNGDPFSRPVVAGTTRTTTTSTTPGSGGSTTTTVALRPPAQVKVLAANGTTTKGLAGRFKDKLSGAGYNALAPTDASKKPVATSTVYFQTGYEAEARGIATLLQIPATAVKPLPTPPPVASLQGANVVVVVGQDKVGTVGATSTTRRTTTTAAHTTTSGRPATSTTSTSR